MNSLNVLPAATTDFEQARHDLREHGVCVVEGVLSAAQVAAARTQLYHAAAEDRRRGAVTDFGLDYAQDKSNQRVWGLLNKGWAFVDLAENGTALDLLRNLLGWPLQLSNISANITGPGGGEMVLHADQLYMPTPWSGVQGANVMWMLDDFTEANGATHMVPGSHRLNRPPAKDEQTAASLPLTGRAGTMVVMDGRVWHKTGNNVTANQTRAGVFAWYTLPIYRTQENWFLSLNPLVRQQASENLLWLLGYKAAGLGLVNGASPQ